MSKSAYGMLAGVAALSVFALAQPASALTMKQCSEKYKTANDAGVRRLHELERLPQGRVRRGRHDGAQEGQGREGQSARPRRPLRRPDPACRNAARNFKAAKDAGTLGGMTWNEFRKAGCVAKTAAAKPAIKKEAARVAPAAEDHDGQRRRNAARATSRRRAAGTLGAMTWNEFRSAGCPTTIAKQSGSMLPTMGSIFPTTIARKYAGQTAGKARMLTCRDQYRANKAAGITEPRWTEEGGGYYSECNKRLSQQ